MENTIYRMEIVESLPDLESGQRTDFRVTVVKILLHFQ